MIPEREREALMRLTMCAREECRVCMYQKRCDFDFQCELATKNMNILAEALRKTESNSEKPNNCEPQTENLFTDKYGDVWEWRGDAWYCISGQDELQTERSE